MIHLRKALRLATLTATSIALAYYGFTYPDSAIAQWLLIFGAISVATSWADVWPAPQDEYPQR